MFGSIRGDIDIGLIYPKKRENLTNEPISASSPPCLDSYRFYEYKDYFKHWYPLLDYFTLSTFCTRNGTELAQSIVNTTRNLGPRLSSSRDYQPLKEILRSSKLLWGDEKEIIAMRKYADSLKG